MSPPNIKPVNRGSMPKGYLLGRTSHGRGPIELLDLTRGLRQLGVATAQAVGNVTSTSGFGFFDGGTLAAGELLGTAVFSRNIQFASGNSSNVVTAEFAPTATATFRMVGQSGGIDFDAGTITFAAASKTGVVAWSPDPFVYVAGTPLKLYAPTVADATLANVHGIVAGVNA